MRDSSLEIRLAFIYWSTASGNKMVQDLISLIFECAPREGGYLSDPLSRTFPGGIPCAQMVRISPSYRCRYQSAFPTSLGERPKRYIPSLGFKISSTEYEYNTLRQIGVELVFFLMGWLIFFRTAGVLRLEISLKGGGGNPNVDWWMPWGKDTTVLDAEEERNITELWVFWCIENILGPCVVPNLFFGYDHQTSCDP